MYSWNAQKSEWEKIGNVMGDQGGEMSMPSKVRMYLSSNLVLSSICSFAEIPQSLISIPMNRVLNIPTLVSVIFTDLMLVLFGVRHTTKVENGTMCLMWM